MLEILGFILLFGFSVFSTVLTTITGVMIFSWSTNTSDRLVWLIPLSITILLWLVLIHYLPFSVAYTG